MTVTTLGNEHPSQVLERQQLTVGWYPGAPAELLVLGEPDPEVGRQPHQVVVPRAALAGELRLHVRPVGGDVFGPGSRVKLTVRSGAAGTDSVSVQLDLSGSGATDVLTLSPLGPDHLRVAVVARPDPLSELATATRAATARALARAGLAPLDRPVRVLLDRSPSMTPWWDAGAVVAVLDALVGVAAAVSSQPTAVAFSSRPDDPVGGGAAALAGAVADLVESVPVVAGAAPTARPDLLLWWVSDAPPPAVDSARVAGTVVLALGAASAARPGGALVELVLPEPRPGTAPTLGPAQLDQLAGFGVDVVAAAETTGGAR